MRPAVTAQDGSIRPGRRAWVLVRLVALVTVLGCVVVAAIAASFLLIVQILTG